jgi:hypothetical protein
VSLALFGRLWQENSPANAIRHAVDRAPLQCTDRDDSLTTPTAPVVPQLQPRNLHQLDGRDRNNGGPFLTKEPKMLLNDNNAGKPEGIHLMIGRRPTPRSATRPATGAHGADTDAPGALQLRNIINNIRQQFPQMKRLHADKIAAVGPFGLAYAEYSQFPLMLFIVL